MDIGSMLSGLGGQQADGATASPTDLVGGLLRQFGGGGGVSVDALGGLVAQLQASGLGEQVQSWVGTGDNKDVDPQQLRAAIGEDKLGGLAAGTGLPIDQLLPMLAAFLPQIVNMLTPKGRLPSAEDGIDPGDLLGSLGGLLGGWR
jgi:uncharacterized protein YidB (DUF937 family)